VSNLRHKLSDGGVAYGCFSLLAEPIWVELIGNAGFDFVVADCEEAGGDSYGPGVDQMVRAADATGIASCVRVVENAPGAINRALNAGADGVFVPHVRSGEEAHQAAQAARYAPLGRRGAAPSVRAAGYGAEEWPAYYRRANEETLLFIMVEDTEGVRNIEDIVKVPGVDGVMVGTWDLSVELGCAGYGPTPAKVMEHVDHVIDVTTNAGLFMAAHAWSAELVGKYVDRGCQVLFASLDSNLLLAGLGSLKQVADRVEKR
jgi:2-keto-3-deoxy-L-rhamnonate aldolase RhmA